jgi:hypothetical protein
MRILSTIQFDPIYRRHMTPEKLSSKLKVSDKNHTGKTLANDTPSVCGFPEVLNENLAVGVSKNPFDKFSAKNSESENLENIIYSCSDELDDKSGLQRTPEPEPINSQQSEIFLHVQRNKDKSSKVKSRENSSSKKSSTVKSLVKSKANVRFFLKEIMMFIMNFVTGGLICVQSITSKRSAKRSTLKDFFPSNEKSIVSS